MVRSIHRPPSNGVAPLRSRFAQPAGEGTPFQPYPVTAVLPVEVLTRGVGDGQPELPLHAVKQLVDQDLVPCL